MSNCSSTGAWRIPWPEEHGRLQSIGSQSDTTETTEHAHLALGKKGFSWTEQAQQALGTRSHVNPTILMIQRGLGVSACVLNGAVTKPRRIPFIYLFLPTWHIGYSFPDQGSNLCHLHWECGVLTTGLSGKSHIFLSKLFSKFLPSCETACKTKPARMLLRLKINVKLKAW